MTLYQAIYIALSLLAFFLSLGNKRFRLHILAAALFINSLPLAFAPQAIGLDTRVFGIPIAYIPIILLGLPVLIGIKSLPRFLQPLLATSVVFIFYITLTSFVPFYARTIPYYGAWIFNFLLFFSSAAIFYRANSEDIRKSLLLYIKVLMIACGVGLFRYVTNVADDANFMPFMNRNGTVVLISLSTPLLFYLYESNDIKKVHFICYLSIIAITVILIQSRSGIICLLFTLIYLNLKTTKKSLVSTLGIVMVLGLILNSGIFPTITEKLIIAKSTISTFISGGEIFAGDNDYQRYMLVQSALRIFSEHMFFGTGVGVPNYQSAFSNVVDFFDRDSKAHNFYISYLAELGIFGFSILILFFLLLFNKIRTSRIESKPLKCIILVLALVMSMSEYILFPELWFLLGITLGISQRWRHSPIHFNGVSSENISGNLALPSREIINKTQP